MDKKTQEQIQEQKSLDKFNSITQKVTPENQNQTHNSRKEGIQPINQKRQSCRFGGSIFFDCAPGGTRFLRVKVPNPPGGGKDIAEGKGVHRKVESEGIRM